MCERSNGKDTTVGHYEIMGRVSEKPFPTYPNGFPTHILRRFSELTGRGVLCNRPYSGTDVIRDYGDAHMKTGDLIVYTSADSVFQVAAEESVVPTEMLYRYCEAARELLSGDDAVARVIARPFKKENGAYKRTEGRRDFALPPPYPTACDLIAEAGYDVIGVGKLSDIFAGRGITESHPTHNNDEGMAVTEALLSRDFNGLCFVNLVDFDMVFGHRRNIDGYAEALNEFDAFLPKLMEKLGDEDLVMITADHGCDPAYTATTDHTREYVPLLVLGKAVKPGNLGTRKSFADIAATVTDLLGVTYETPGESFAKAIL
jgi:phosphopentomutase